VPPSTRELFALALSGARRRRPRFAEEGTGLNSRPGWGFHEEVPMRGRILLLGLGFLGALVPASAIAQSSSEVRYPDGLVIQPLPVVPGVYPNDTSLSIPGLGASASPLGESVRYSRPAAGVDVDVTGSTAPRTMSVLPERDIKAPVNRPGRIVQNYAFGPGERVRVHRC
jgi:hypothetical protein